MAKINRATRQNIWQVEIIVDDPDCKWNITPTSTYYKIIKANNENAAMRGAANHCTKQMEAFPGVHLVLTKLDSHQMHLWLQLLQQQVLLHPPQPDTMPLS